MLAYGHEPVEAVPVKALQCNGENTVFWTLASDLKLHVLSEVRAQANFMDGDI